MPLFLNVFVAVLLGIFLPSTICVLPGDDMPVLTVTSCSTDADCLTYYWSRCNSGSCTTCNANSQCTRFASNAYCNSGRCFIPCDNSNVDVCRLQRVTCPSSDGRCLQCYNTGDCAGYPTPVYCQTSGSQSMGLCVNCRNNADCSTGFTCLNYKCQQCSSDTGCSAPTPYCIKAYEQNACKQCRQNTDCPNAASSQCSSSNSCAGCSGNGDCTHISGKPVCSSGTCVECSSNTHCTNPAKSSCSSGTCVACSSHPQCSHLTPNTYCLSGTCINAECTTVGECTNVLKSSCNLGTKFCEMCTYGSGQCSHITANPLCAGSPNGCVQCLTSTNCPTEAASVCNSAGVCQRCLNNNDCTKFTPKPVCDTSVGCVECMVDSTCTSTLKSRCTSNVCQLCSTDPQCSHLTATPVCSNTATGCVECKIDSTCTNPLKAHCNSGFACELCSSHGHCNHFSSTKVCSFDATLGCVECMTNSDCQNVAKSFCDTTTHTCKLCSGDPQCSHLSLTPYCSSTKCTECLTNSHCTTIAKSYCNPSYVCQVCTIDSQCTHLTATRYCSTADSRCAECTSNSHCTIPAKSNCVSASKTCQVCTGDPQCSHLPATPRCSLTSFGCVECMSNTECTTTAKSYCYPSTHICQSCFSDTGNHCSHLPNVNKCWYGECVIYSPVCVPTYSISIVQEKTLNDFVIDFDATLVTKINILSTIKIKLIDIETVYYSYTVVKVTNTQFKVNFQVQKTIPKTQIQVQVPCPTQPGYVYGNITKEVNTKKIPFASDALKGALETLGNVATAATTAVSGISGAMMFMGANPMILWALLGSIQTFYYMLFINVEYPANVQAFFPIFALGNLDFIPNPTWVFFPNIDEFSLPVPARFEEHEVDGLFLANAGNMVFLWIGNLALYGFSYLVMRYTRNQPRLLGMGCSKVVEIFEWSGIFRTFITSYMELTIASFLQLRVLDFGSGLFSASSICAILFGTFGVMLPVFTYKIVQRYDTDPKYIKLKFGTLIEGYKLNDDIHKYFTVITIGRNMILAASLVYLHNYPYIEIITLTTLSFSFAYLVFKYKPYDNRVSNISTFISELVFGMVHIFIFILIHDDYSPRFLDEERMNLGWGIIAGCGIILMSSMAVAIAEQVSVAITMIGLLKQVLRKEKKTHQKRMKKLTTKIKRVKRDVMQVADESMVTLNQSHDNSFPALRVIQPEITPAKVVIKRPVNLTTERRRKIKR